MQIQTPSPAPDRSGAPSSASSGPLWRQAQELEVRFMAEMLRHGGLGAPPETANGGIGEEQFASFLREAQARAVTEAGGIGLAEMIFRSLEQRSRA